MRTGIGYDVHRFEKGRKLILGGVEIPHEKGLLGHSDADVLLHAVTDALLGAAGLGDIGTHFPDSDLGGNPVPEYRLRPGRSFRMMPQTETATRNRRPDWDSFSG